MKKVPILMILLFAFIYWSKELDKKTVHGHSWNESRSTQSGGVVENAGKSRDVRYDSIRLEKLKGLGILPDDSLERMYDRNYMDFDLYNNPDDDDEWHDYFND